MIVVLLNVYLVIFFLLVKLHIVRFNLFWKISPVIVLLLLLIGLFIPMGWGAPQGSAVVVRNSVAIVPDVAGEVVEVPVTANAPLKAGTVLFRIDPTPYDAQVKAIEAQLKLSSTRLAQMTQLFERDCGRGFDVEQRQAEVDQLKAQLEGAQWNFDKTTVRAPSDGYVTNLALRKGARVANLPLAPVMAFIDTSSTLIGVEWPRSMRAMSRRDRPLKSPSNIFPAGCFPAKWRACCRRSRPGRCRRRGSRSSQRASRRRRLSRASGSTIPRWPIACRPAAPARPRFSRIG
jgi:hypothetical protein